MDGITDSVDMSLSELRVMVKDREPAELQSCTVLFCAESLSHVQLFVTSWTAAHQASLSITNSWSLPKLMSIESVMPSSHLIL